MSRNSPPSPRRLALRVLRHLEQKQEQGVRAFSNRLLDHELERYPELEQRDRGLITTLVYGVLRHLIRLDALIDRAAKAPNKLKGEVRQALRIGVYELLELARPLPIASAEAARLLSTIDPQGRLRPVVGGILKTIATNVTTWESASATRDPSEHLHLRYGLPHWLAQRWLAQLGVEQAQARAAASLEIPRVDLRVDLSRTTVAEVMAQLHRDHPGIEIDTVPDSAPTLRVRGGSDLFYGPLHEAGLISVQSQGSTAAGFALAPQPGERILDACCGMGTKLLHLAEQMQRRGEIWACDANAQRLAEIDNLRQRGDLVRPELQVHVLCGDLTDRKLALLSDYDGVLVDAPCTGLGNLARHPEIRSAVKLSDIHECANLQRRLLLACLDRVRDGGRLVYSVCSLEPEEGPAHVAALLHQPPPGLHLDLEAQATLAPERDGCDGMYWARLRVQRRHSSSSASPQNPPM